MASPRQVPKPEPTGHFVLLHEQDNILVCARTASAGSIVEIDGNAITLTQDIPLGHKVARCAMAAGDKVRRYGVAIGSMCASAQPGDHIHSHNLKSDYIPAHSREAVRIWEIRS